MNAHQGLERRLSITRSWRHATRASALFATLPLASRPERTLILRELVELLQHTPTPHPRLLPTLLQHWRQVPPDARARCLTIAGARVAEEVEHLRRTHRAAEAAAIAALCLDTPVQLPQDTLRRLLPTPAQLGDHDEAVASAAAHALHLLANRIGRAPHDRDAIDEALAETVATWPDHRRQEAIDAALHTAHLAGPFLRTWLQDERQPGHMALRAAARQLPLPLQRRLLVHWLAIPALSALAISRLEQAHELEDRLDVWRRAHLLSLRGRTPLLTRVRGLNRHLPTDADLAHAGPSGRIGYVRLLRAAPVSRECRLKELARLRDDPCTPVRMVAALDLARLPADRAADELLLECCFDEDERVARASTLALTTARTARRRIWLQPALDRLAHASHASVRQIAAEALQTPRHTTPRWNCPVAERRALRDDPEAFIRALRARLADGEVSQRLQALRLVDRFRLWSTFEDELRQAARAEDERVASKAVLLVARLRGDESDHVINAAIRHSDPRVHANAIEAKLMRNPSTSWVVRMRHNDVPRARANVIRHIIRQTDGAACSQDMLRGMLEDARPAHRVSALWVAERLNCQALRPRIDTMATSDLPGIAARAARCARRLTTLGAELETVA